MQRTTTQRHQGNRETFASAFWLAAGIVILIASGDALALLIGAVAIATLAWGIIRAIDHRVRNRAELAPVTQLRPALNARRDAKQTPAQGFWRGPRAA